MSAPCQDQEPGRRSRAGHGCSHADPEAPGAPEAPDQLFEVLYQELRRRAADQMRGQRRDHTLQPTALLHELYLRLARSERTRWKDREHFVRFAIRTMRSLLVDHARSRLRDKRDPGGERVPLDLVLGSIPAGDPDLVALDQALVRLEAHDPRLAQVVEMRYFGGCSVALTATLLGLARRTVERDWTLARAWLHRELGDG